MSIEDQLQKASETVASWPEQKQRVMSLQTPAASAGYALDSLKLYRPPFSYHCGYIFDANHNMVADDAGGCEGEAAILRIRGWGRIGGLESGAELQDAIGEHVAAALTGYWYSHQSKWDGA